MNNKYTVGDLFAGAGGLSKALQLAGANIIWANEIDRDACSLYRENLGGEWLTEGDIRHIDAENMPNFDILVAGFPCQAFSVLGKRSGFDDESGNLFFQIVRILKQKKPRVVLLESVKSIKLFDGGTTFKIIIKSLEDEGYYIKYEVLNSINFGNIPHNKERMYIVCFKELKEYEMFEFPQRIDLTMNIKDVIDFKNKKEDRYYYTEDSKYYTQLKEEIKSKERIYQLVFQANNKGNYSVREYNFCPNLASVMGTRYVPVIFDDFNIRKMTPIECFCFQGYFDIKIPIKINNNKLYTYAGQSSSVIVVKRIAENIINALNSELSNNSIYNKKDIVIDKISFNGELVHKSQNVVFIDELERLYYQVDKETDIYKKGKDLEYLMVEFFSRVKGFEDVTSDIRTETEEIDIVIVNKSDNHIFKKEASLILVECKNWNGKVGRYNLDSLQKKISNRKGRCTIGFFVAWNGITNDFEKELLRGSREGIVIIILDKYKIKEAIVRNDIERYLESEFKNEVLR